jgi:uncharacterized cupin superfamily protein
MSQGLIEVGNTKASLAACPIEPSWIIEGNPVAQSTLLSRSADGTASTIVWQCSPGKFNWYYDFDETILILEGSVVLESDSMRPTRYGPGDVVFFRDGAHAKWHVESQIRKLAFCRKTQPYLLGLTARAISKLKRMISSGSKASSLTLVGSQPLGTG